MEKNIYYKVEVGSADNWCVFEEKNFMSSLKEWIDESEIGDKFVIERVEMTEEEYEALGEYQG